MPFIWQIWSAPRKPEAVVPLRQSIPDGACPGHRFDATGSGQTPSWETREPSPLGLRVCREAHCDGPTLPLRVVSFLLYISIGQVSYLYNERDLFT